MERGVTGQRGCHVCVSVWWELLEWNLQYKYSDSRMVRCVFAWFWPWHAVVSLQLGLCRAGRGSYLITWHWETYRKTRRAFRVACVSITMHPFFFMLNETEKRENRVKKEVLRSLPTRDEPWWDTKFQQSLLDLWQAPASVPGASPGIEQDRGSKRGIYFIIEH